MSRTFDPEDEVTRLRGFLSAIHRKLGPCTCDTKDVDECGGKICDGDCAAALAVMALSTVEGQVPNQPPRIKIVVDDPETREIWETAKRAAAEVAAWPAWKRGEASVSHPMAEDGSEPTTGAGDPDALVPDDLWGRAPKVVRETVEAIAAWAEGYCCDGDVIAERLRSGTWRKP